MDLSYPDPSADKAKVTQIALATIQDRLDRSNLYTVLPSSLVDALLEVARESAALVAAAEPCLCGKCVRPLTTALTNFCDEAVPI